MSFMVHIVILMESTVTQTVEFYFILKLITLSAS